MAFLLSFFQFVQPGILIPALEGFKPMLILSVLAGLVIVATRPLALQITALGHSAFVAIVFFVLAQGASVHYSGVASIVETLARWYIYPVFVLLAVFLIADMRDLRGFVWGVILGAQWVIFYGFYALNADRPSVGPGAGAYGMYENHNDYTYPIILVVPFLYLLRRSEERPLVRLLLMVFLVASIFGVFVSLSRGGILALVLEAALLLSLTSRSVKRVAVLVVLGLLATFAVDYLWTKRAETQGSNYTAEDAEQSRFELWKAGKNMFLAHPLLGVGSSRFGEFSRDYAEISHDNVGKNSHNTYIEVLADSGLVGFVPFMIFLFASARELRIPAGPVEDPTFGAIRNAARISLYSTMFRALTNAKPHDWSFYVLSAIALSCAMLRDQAAGEEDEEERLPCDTGPGGRRSLAGRL